MGADPPAEDDRGVRPYRVLEIVVVILGLAALVGTFVFVGWFLGGFV